MDVLNNFRNVGFDISFIVEIGNVFVIFFDDDVSFFGGYYSLEGELGLGVFFVCFRGGFVVRVKVVVYFELVY